MFEMFAVCFISKLRVCPSNCGIDRWCSLLIRNLLAVKMLEASRNRKDWHRLRHAFFRPAAKISVNVCSWLSQNSTEKTQIIIDLLQGEERHGPPSESRRLNFTSSAFPSP